MDTATLISVDEYLNTSYSPDKEFVDGALVEINVGDPLHSSTQSNIVYAIRFKYPHLKALPELRSRTTKSRFRLPDVCVTHRTPTGRFLDEPPIVAIEILSEDDRMTRVIEKLKEYAALGTPNIWVLDPRARQMFVFRGNALQEIEGDVIASESPRLELTRDEIFQD